MKRRSVLMAVICAVMAPYIKASPQKNGVYITPESDEMIGIELDIETLKGKFKGKVWGLVVKYNDRKVCLTPDQVMDILEGKEENQEGSPCGSTSTVRK